MSILPKFVIISIIVAVIILVNKKCLDVVILAVSFGTLAVSFGITAVLCVPASSSIRP